MSSTGPGGYDNAHNAPPGGGQQPPAGGFGHGSPPQPGLASGAPSWQSPPGGQGYGGGYGAPENAGNGPGYGGPPAPPATSSKRPWALIAVACACIGALVLVIGGAAAYLVLGGGLGSEDPTAGPSETSTEETPSETEGTATETATEEPSDFKVVSPIDEPPGDADDLHAIMGNNPLTGGSLPDVSSCELPETPADADLEQMQALLDAAAPCLNQVWASASSDRGLPWSSPAVVAYEWPEIPNSSCEEARFSEDLVTTCNLDNTIYWPVGYGVGTTQSDDADAPGAFLWDLSYSYMQAVSWQSSIGTYYLTLWRLRGENDTPEGVETWRRYILQMQCLSSAASMQMPSGAQPSSALRESLLEESAWNEGSAPTTLQPASRVLWMQRGFESGGDLSACNTWDAPEDEVA